MARGPVLAAAMRKAVTISAAVVATVLVANLVFPFVWYSPAIDGRIVDAVTGRPVPGAVVLMTWETRGSQGMTLGPLAVEEAVANERGEFHIAAWGPRFAIVGTVSYGQPTTRVLHPDYAPLNFSNTEAIPWGRDPRFIRIKYHHDGQIELSRPAATAEARVEALAAFASTMWIAYFGKHCEWTHAGVRWRSSSRCLPRFGNRVTPIVSTRSRPSTSCEHKATVRKSELLQPSVQ